MCFSSRRAFWLRCVVFGAFIFCFCHATLAQKSGSPDNQQQKISNVFFDTDLRQALSDIATQAGTTIIPDPTVNGLVTADLKDVPLDKALDIVLTGTGYRVKKLDDLYLVYSPSPESPAFESVSETKYVRLQHAEAEAAGKMLPENYQQYTRADAEGNTIRIRAPKEIIEKIVADLKAFDQPRGHVLLDARIVVLEHSELLNIGVDWDFPSIQAGTFTTSDFHGGGAAGPDWPWAVQIGYNTSREFTDSLLLRLNLLRQNEEATIMATPQVMAQDGKPAEIKVAREEYFKITTGGLYNNVDLEQIDTGTLLTILPRLNDNGEIMLNVVAEVSDVVSRGQDNLPVVTRRQAKSTVRIKNGGTVAIAGLMDARSRQKDRMVPGAWRAPLIGRAFESQVDENQTRQIAVFVTARVVPEGAREIPETVRRPKQSIPQVTEDEFKPKLLESLRRISKARKAREQ